ncbi:FAD-dependent oxidoreductase [Paracoccus marcusii]|uniref:FAD-dependent oxidoreductase n=1 Tax=Paracoccus marcusii TaxID=59779 RepID=UPI002ED6117D|nr:FAD-dependent oxidoreductase [Paracoccus marcusii]
MMWPLWISAVTARCRDPRLCRAWHCDQAAGRLYRTAAGDGPTAAAALIGGGVAGAEIALALRHRGARAVTLIEAGPVAVATLRPRSRRHMMQALEGAGIGVVTQARIAAVEPDAVLLADGSRIASALTLGIAGARAHGWMARTLPVDGAGFVRVMPTLQVEGIRTCSRRATARR